MIGKPRLHFSLATTLLFGTLTAGCRREVPPPPPPPPPAPAGALSPRGTLLPSSRERGTRAMLQVGSRIAGNTHLQPNAGTGS